MRIDTHYAQSIPIFRSDNPSDVCPMSIPYSDRIEIIIPEIISIQTPAKGSSGFTQTIRAISHLIDQIRMTIVYSDIDHRD